MASLQCLPSYSVNLDPHIQSQANSPFRKRIYYLICVHIFTNIISYTAKTGGFFPDFEASTGKYVEKVSADVKEWIKKLREQGKTLFHYDIIERGLCQLHHGLYYWVNLQRTFGS